MSREVIFMEMYKEFKRLFGNRAVSMELLLYIQDSKLEEEIVAFYPENWFVNDQSPEIFIFTKNDIVRVMKNHKALEIDVYKDLKATKLSYSEHLNDRYAGSKLEFSLKSGDHIILDASNDANADCIEYSNRYIKEVFNILK